MSHETDLPAGKQSGLKQVVKILKGVEDVAICPFTQKDVVRHPLVQRIIAAYEKFEQSRSGPTRPARTKYEERQGRKHG